MATLRSTLIFAALIFAAVSLQALGQTAGSIQDGVFSEKQASDGERMYADVCSSCHLEDAFSAGSYLDGWHGESVDDLVTFIQDTMPEDNPGGLRRSEYVEIVAYIFKLNGIAAGDADMLTSPDDLRNLRIEGPTAPEPLPAVGQTAPEPLPAVGQTAPEPLPAVGQTEGSIQDGVFSEKQASDGEKAYADVCSACHMEDAFTAGSYLDGWDGQTVDDMVTFIQDTMPEDNPGGLKRSEYVEIVAYIFKLNGIATGDADMLTSPDDLQHLRIEGPFVPGS